MAIVIPSAFSGIFGLLLLISASIVLDECRKTRDDCKAGIFKPPPYLNDYCASADAYVGATAVGTAAGIVLIMVSGIALLPLVDRVKNAMLVGGHIASFVLAVTAFALGLFHDKDDFTRKVKNKSDSWNAKFIFFYVSAGLDWLSCLICVANLVYRTKEGT